MTAKAIPVSYTHLVEGSMITIDSVWDTTPNVKATEILKPYKEKVDAMMYEVIGTSAMKMDKGAPESLLSDLVAGVLQQAATQVLGKPADMGLVNMGGLRNILPEGDITVGDVFEILPFENSLCVLTMKGTDLRRLCEAIASLHGEGVSGIRLEITKDGKLLNAFIAGKPLKDDQLYTCLLYTSLSATIAPQFPDQEYNLRHTSSSYQDNKSQQYFHSLPHP